MNNKNFGLNKKTKKSKHGKKNWRKNIDVSEIEKKENKLNSEKINESRIQNLKDEELFVFDMAGDMKKKNNLLNKKTDRKKGQKSKNEERLIKQIKKVSNDGSTVVIKKKEEELVNLWDDEAVTTVKSGKGKYQTTRPAIQYPKVPLPHPGQSYNPDKNDISNLLHKVIEINKRPEITDQITKDDLIDEQLFLSEEESEQEEEFKVSNNPPVDDFTGRKTRTERNKDHTKKLNRLKDKELRLKKENKINLANEKSLKRIEEAREKGLTEDEEKKKEVLRKKKEKEQLMKIGIVEE